MATERDDDLPERDRLQPRIPDRDYDAGPPKQTVLKSLLGGAFGLTVVYLFFAFKAGLFPFAGVTGTRGHLKDILVKQLNLPVESVALTSEGRAEATLTSGEVLNVWYREQGNQLECLCQKPKAEAEAFVRQLIEQMKYEPKTVNIRRSPTGMGYVGDATAVTGEEFDVTEATDATAYKTMQYVKLSLKSYPAIARGLFEKEFNMRVAGTDAVRPNDLPADRFPGGANPLVQRETVYTSRFRTDAGKVYAVELYLESSVIRPPGDQDFGELHWLAFPVRE